MRLNSVVRLVGIVSVCTAGSAGADFVVLQSDAGNLEAGEIIADNRELSVPADQRVVLLSDEGEVVEINGPYDGPPEAASADEVDIRNALAELIDSTANTHARLASTRSASIATGSAPPTPRDALYLDPFYTGMQCILPDTTPVFWRNSADEALSLVMQRPGQEGTSKLSWSAGEATAAWPSDMPLVNDELYVLRRPGWLENAMIQVIVLPPGIDYSGTTAVAWLAAHGCTGQAAISLAQLP